MRIEMPGFQEIVETLEEAKTLKIKYEKAGHKVARRRWKMFSGKVVQVLTVTFKNEGVSNE